jgi:hypothetical protein
MTTKITLAKVERCFEVLFIGQNTGLVAVFSPTFFDSSENWHSESFQQKIDNYNLVKPKSIPQKNYRVTNFSFFHHFSIILSLITQRVFIAKTCA